MLPRWLLATARLVVLRCKNSGACLCGFSSFLGGRFEAARQLEAAVVLSRSVDGAHRCAGTCEGFCIGLESL